MMNRSSLLAAWALMILAMASIGSATYWEEPRLFVSSSSASVTITGNVVPSAPPVTPVTNPAATFCVNKGYRHEIRTDPVTGNQIGYCVFPDASECEAWAFFRGTCTFTPAPVSGPGEEPVGPVPPSGEGDGDDGAGDGDGGDGGDGAGLEGDGVPTPGVEAASDLERIAGEMEPLLAKEAAGTLTPEEAAALTAKRLELLEAEMAFLELEGRRLSLEAERLALQLEVKGIERRALLGAAEEGDDDRLEEIKALLLILDLREEVLEIEGRGLSGAPLPEDEGRLSELAEAMAYLEGSGSEGGAEG